MRIIKESDLRIDEVVEVLRSGGLVVYPTETVYGLGVDATNDKAVEKLWKFKGERGDKPVLVAVANTEMARSLVILNEVGEMVTQKYWPGPVSVVAKSKNRVAKKVQGDTDTLGLRMPKQNTVLKIVELLGRPITSTSANVSGVETARSLEKFLETVPKEKQELIDIFIDSEELPVRLPSTIVDATEDEIRVLRRGETAVEI